MTRHYEVGKGQGRWVGQEIRGREPFLEQQHKGSSGRSKAQRVGGSEGTKSSPSSPRLPDTCSGRPLAHSMWTSRTSPQAGAAAWPSAPSSTSSSRMPLTTLSWTPSSAGTTSPWPSPPQSKPQPRRVGLGGSSGASQGSTCGHIETFGRSRCFRTQQCVNPAKSLLAF